MKKRIFNYLSLISLCILLSFSCQKEEVKKKPTAHKGFLDLKDWDFAKHGIIPINGEWEFYFGQFLLPDEFTSGKGDLSGYVNIPGTWKKFSIDGKPIMGTGFATLRLNIQPPLQNQALAIKTGTIGVSFRLICNGQEILRGGKPGKTEAETIPGFNPSVVYLPKIQD